MIDGLYGINIAVRDLDEATARFESLLGSPGQAMGADDFAFPGLRGTRFAVGGLYIHLLASTRSDTAIARFVEKRGEGVFLIQLRTQDLGTVLTSLKARGIGPLHDPPQDTFLGRVTFIHPKDLHGVQMELIETH
ncbi:methylmalonyl-CoA epimerase [Pseudonocardia ailaonensis]|uniref:Methylmalonyl-CoA epimerase n=1 Tax=Pseudonocardia ailaonensis TaxID=367279 RepID=A0ABN2N3W6_9PSEU